MRTQEFKPSTTNFPFGRMNDREKARFLVTHQRDVTEEMRLQKEVQDEYNKKPYGDERDQLELPLENPNFQRDYGDETDYQK